MKNLLSSKKSIIGLLTMVVLTIGTHSLKATRLIGIESISINGIVTGNGFGLNYAPTLGIHVGPKFFFSGGPILGARNFNNMGTMLSANYILVPESESHSGNFFLSTNLTYTRINNAELNPKAMKNDKGLASSIARSEETNFNELRFSGWEISQGFNLNYHCDSGLLFRGGAALVYTDTQTKCERGNCFARENQTMVLQLSFGMGWRFQK